MFYFGILERIDTNGSETWEINFKNSGRPKAASSGSGLLEKLSGSSAIDMRLQGNNFMLARQF